LSADSAKQSFLVKPGAKMFLQPAKKLPLQEVPQGNEPALTRQENIRQKKLKPLRTQRRQKNEQRTWPGPNGVLRAAKKKSMLFA
jgi:hypothetical protein